MGAAALTGSLLFATLAVVLLVLALTCLVAACVNAKRPVTSLKIIAGGMACAAASLFFARMI